MAKVDQKRSYKQCETLTVLPPHVAFTQTMGKKVNVTHNLRKCSYYNSAT
jgi:hypothetical protein